MVIMVKKIRKIKIKTLQVKANSDNVYWKLADWCRYCAYYDRADL